MRGLLGLVSWLRILGGFPKSTEHPSMEKRGRLMSQKECIVLIISLALQYCDFRPFTGAVSARPPWAPKRRNVRRGLSSMVERSLRKRGGLLLGIISVL